MNEESKNEQLEDTPASSEAAADETESPAAEEPVAAEGGEEAGAEAVAADATSDEAAGDAPDEAEISQELEEPSEADQSAAQPTAEVSTEADEPDAEEGGGEPEAVAEVADELPPETAVPTAEEPSQGETATESEYSYEMLNGMNVHQLQEVAAAVDHDAVHGYSVMHKDELLHALCVALELEEHVHHEVIGIDKFAVKAKITALKLERDEAFAAGDTVRVKRIRRRIHNLKHRLRKATV